MQKTTWTRKEDTTRNWHLVDVKDQILGRASTKIAALLIGKHKVSKSPNVDNGDYVVVINSADIKLSRGKESKKLYQTHTQFPGGFKELRFEEVLKQKPTKPMIKAIERMLPVNKLKADRMARLFVYADANHKHMGQAPKEYKLENKK